MRTDARPPAASGPAPAGALPCAQSQMVSLRARGGLLPRATTSIHIPAPVWTGGIIPLKGVCHQLMDGDIMLHHVISHAVFFPASEITPQISASQKTQAPPLKSSHDRNLLLCNLLFAALNTVLGIVGNLWDFGRQSPLPSKICLVHHDFCWTQPCSF